MLSVSQLLNRLTGYLRGDETSTSSSSDIVDEVRRSWVSKVADKYLLGIGVYDGTDRFLSFLANATPRAADLLYSVLNPEQREVFADSMFVPVIGSKYGAYLVSRHFTGRIYFPSEHFVEALHLCINPRGSDWLHPFDAIAAKVLLLQSDEHLFRSIANEITTSRWTVNNGDHERVLALQALREIWWRRTTMAERITHNLGIAA